MAYFISNDIVKEYADAVGNFSKVSGVPVDEVLSALENHYIGIATTEERKSRRGGVHDNSNHKTFGYVGTYYPALDEFSDWDAFTQEVKNVL